MWCPDLPSTSPVSRFKIITQVELCILAVAEPTGQPGTKLRILFIDIQSRHAARPIVQIFVVTTSRQNQLPSADKRWGIAPMECAQSKPMKILRRCASLVKNSYDQEADHSDKVRMAKRPGRYHPASAQQYRLHQGFFSVTAQNQDEIRLRIESFEL